MAVAGMALLARAGDAAPPRAAPKKEAPKQEAPAPGIYIEQPLPGGKRDLLKVAPSTPSRQGMADLKKTVVAGMFTGGLGGKPKMSVFLAGPHAATRFAGPPMFQIHLDPAGAAPAGGADSADPAAMMAMMAQQSSGELPAGARAESFVLARLETKGEERALKLTMERKPDKGVACRIFQVGPTSFRVVPEQPLPPGEYGFFAVPDKSGMGASEMVWDFGVDAP
jgi:hypothetical protein